MAKSQKRVITALALVMLLLLSVCVFSACGRKDCTVTFMIEGKSEVVSVVDGKVTLPEDPTKDGYIFRGWYTDESFATPFQNAEIKESMTVYAYFVPVSVHVHVNGVDKGEVQMKDYDSFTGTYQNDALAQNLTFDGWFVDAGCTTRYTTQDVDDLYARYMAEVVFDNGYEVVYTELVQPGTAMKEPATASVQKQYMDAEDLSYSDSEGNAFDFTKKIDGNLTISVLWKTPYLMYEPIKGTANYAAVGLESKYYETWSAYPCISVLSRNVTVGADDNGNAVRANVVSVKGFETISGGLTFARTDSAVQLMFADGIEYITGLIGSQNNMVETIVLPDTLKILEKSIWNFSGLTSIDIPEGTEVIIDCFWKDYLDYANGCYRDKGYEIGIVIPAGVKTLSLVPANVQFADGSPYFVENNRIYRRDGETGKILVSDYWSNVDSNGALTVPEGVTGIQCGVLETIGVIGAVYDYEMLKYIYLPSTLTKVAYTADRSDYDAVYDGELLTDHNYLTSPAGHMGSRAYAIVGNLGKITYVIFNTTDYPAGFNGNTSLFTNGTTTFDKLPERKLVYTATVTEGDISVNITYSNSMDSAPAKQTVITMPTGSSVSREELLEQIGLTSEAIGVNIEILSIRQFGQDYAFGSKNCNQYIDIVFGYAAAGVTTAENADGTLTVTGFDPSKAQELENGTYLIVVPNYIDGKEVTAIGEGAFKGENRLSKVYISNSVKTIGAEAFMNTENLELVSVTPGGLEFIGRSAFENAGAILEDGAWKINPDMPTFKFSNFRRPTVYLYIPLADLKTVEPYAFKSVAICTFMPVEGEEQRIVMTFNFSGSPVYSDLKANGFYYMINAASDVTSIVQYVSTSVERKATCNSQLEAGTMVDVNVIDVRYIARAAGYEYNGYCQYISLGWGMRPYGMINAEYDTNVVRYEMMEGSMYFAPSYEFITFGIVSKVHRNAFTDMGTEKDGVLALPRIRVYNREGEGVWLKKDDIVNQSADIFEEGWWEGIANSENNATNDVSDTTDMLTY